MGIRDGHFKIGRAARKEALAGYVHYMWKNWVKVMLSDFTPKNIERWRYIANLRYRDLTNEDKNFCRTWAEKILEFKDGEIGGSKDPDEQFKIGR